MGLITQTGQQYYSTASPTPFGDYQFVSLEHVINQFIIAYVGEDKIISKIKRTDVAFHAMRALQELSFDTFKSIKSQEIILPPSLQMILPQDYVNYVKISCSDSNGVERVLYPISITSNPSDVLQKADGTYDFDSSTSLTTDNSSTTWEAFKSNNANDNNHNHPYHDHNDHDMYNRRYGLDPQFTQSNGSFYIDPNTGKIHFSSNVSGKTVVLEYISDSLGTDAEMKVHKFAEEAMYKHIAYAVMSTRKNIQEYIVQRFKKERFAETRKAKLRLSNIKQEELTQILRGKSKQIKH